MEGLLPMAFKAIKRSRTRRRYECLSAGAAQSFDADDWKTHFAEYPTADRSIETNGGRAHRHRRWSVGDISSFSCQEERHDGDVTGDRTSPRPGQLVRFRSHRLFSCLSSGE
ncbi:PREDICTED: uncharacterized protein LOC104827561 [Tarenaya hassleriana]|uniref:uncharacterized protein LOC104827561 n=1 Tax=Tarenaya hassleriana TaxID=28532 RepID=UPI00053C2B85|nr:PREDICTED: uncharacterized protein LOC104827561 [Tarenaya hassleriana]